MTKSKTKRTKPAKQAESVKRAAPKPEPKTYLLFGTDEYAKPRAAKSTDTDPASLAKPAEAMHLRMLEVRDPELAEIVRRLPIGRPHATGTGLVPYITGNLYFELVAATVGDQRPPANGDAAVKEWPRGWDEVKPGHLVIVRETLECGWWEAIVIERNGDLGSPSATAIIRSTPSWCGTGRPWR